MEAPPTFFANNEHLFTVAVDWSGFVFFGAGFICGTRPGFGAAAARAAGLLSAVVFAGAPAGGFALVSGLASVPSGFGSVFASTPGGFGPVSDLPPAPSDFVSVAWTPGGLGRVSGLAAVTGGFASAFGSMFGFALMPGGFAAIDGFASAGLVSVFVDEGGVSSPGLAIVLPAGAFLSRGVGALALGVTVSALPGFDPGSAVAGSNSRHQSRCASMCCTNAAE
jgi:hypothetical protein